MALLVLPSEVTQSQAETCLTMLRTAARTSQKSEIVIDAAPLNHFDSSALAVLLACRRECLSDGKRFSVVGMPPRLAELAELYGVASLLPSQDAKRQPTPSEPGRTPDR